MRREPVGQYYPQTDGDDGARKIGATDDVMMLAGAAGPHPDRTAEFRLDAVVG